MKNKKTSLSKRGLCVLLACLLLLTLFPLAAATPPANPTVVATGAVGGAAPWRLYSDGTVRVASGFILWEAANHGWRSPWNHHAAQVRRIIFTGPITAGHSLSGLFSELPHLEAIEGLSYFNTQNVTDMGWMFNETNLRSLNLSGFHTNNVRYMDGMFAFTSLQSLDLSSFDTRNVINMDWMFRSSSNLQSLNLQSFDTRNVQFMGQMFRYTGLREITLGQNFQFVSDEEGARHAGLPPVPQNNTYTGRWQHIGPGSPQNPQGSFEFTSAGFQAQYNGAAMAGVFVWQPILRTPIGLPFFDVAQNHWALDAIRFMYRGGIMHGTSQTTFAPEATLTRAAVIAVLHRVAGNPPVAWSPIFTDVPIDAPDWYRDAVIWAATSGIVSGVGQNRFAPDNPITREQLAVMLYQYAYFMGYDTSLPTLPALNNFQDAADVSVWARDAMIWAVEHNLIVGSGGLLNPGGTATRAQCATILQRFIEGFVI